MFHQVFICDTTEEPDCSRNVILEQNIVNNDPPQTLKQENITSGNLAMGFLPAENLKMAVDELKLEKCNEINDQLVMETDTQVTQEGLETKDSLSVMPSCSNTENITSGNLAMGFLPAENLKMAVNELKLEKCNEMNDQLVMETDTQVTQEGLETKDSLSVMPSCSNTSSSLPTTCVSQQPQTVLQPQPSLIKMNDNMSAAPGVLQAVTVTLDPVTGMINTCLGQQPVLDTQSPTMKHEPSQSVSNAVDMNTLVTELKSEKPDLTNSQVKIERDEEPMEDDILPDLEDSSVTEVHLDAVKFRECVSKKVNQNLNLRHNIRRLEMGRKEAIGLIPDITEHFLKVQYIQNNTKLEKHDENESYSIVDSALRSKYNIKECIVSIENSFSKDISPKTDQDSTLENQIEPVLKDCKKSSFSDSEEEHTDDDSSGSDWEAEYLGEKLNSKPPERLKKEICNNTVDAVQNINITNHSIHKNSESYSKSLECSSEEIITEYRTQIATDKFKMSSATSNKNLLYKLPISPTPSVSITISDTSRSSSSNSPHVSNDPLPSQIYRKSFIKNNKSSVQRTKTIQIMSKSRGVPSGSRTVKVQNFPSVTKTLSDEESMCSDNYSDTDDGVNNDKRSSKNKLSQVPYCFYNCNKCNRQFDKSDRYLYHKKYSVCSGYKMEARHQCDICGHCFTSREKMEAHVNSHTNARPFKCFDCDKYFNSRVARQMHHKKMHLNKKVIFLCYFCGYTTPSPGHILAHEESHRLPEGAEIPKPFKCLVCGKGFVSLWKQQKHKKEHMLKKCVKCSEKFKTDSQLRNHMEAAHSISKSYECKECGKQFKSAKILSHHRKFVHSSVMSLFCDICDKGFKRRCNLTQHMITHSEDRPISCPECGDKFKRITHLKQHTAAFHGDGRKK